MSIDISSSPPPSAQARLTSGPTEVGRDRLSWKGVLVGEGVGVRVDESGKKSDSSQSDGALSSHLNTAGVPLPNPLISNIIMCIRNSPTLYRRTQIKMSVKRQFPYLEQEAQKGPQVFFPP